MAVGSLLTLLDDIASVLDDVSAMTKVATMTKIAAKKTAGVLGDDLALNAQQVLGVSPEREIPIVWAVAKGSLLNKIILAPSVLAISFYAPWAIRPLLMIGGLFLCYEGFEKVAHKFLHSNTEDKAHQKALSNISEKVSSDMQSLEKEKIKGAIRTDFILSAEIIVIALGTVATQSFTSQAAVVGAVSLLMTFGVYGLVAAIVKMDDFGLYLLQKEGRSGFKQFSRKFGRSIISVMPYFMRALSILGTAAMFLVGGAILVDGIPELHHWIGKFSGWSYLLDGFFWTMCRGFIIGSYRVL